jgi:2'-hydroxyisoflavone reductase
VRILVLGGTRFVGRHIVAAALDRGHDVTLVHRGRTNPDLFPEVERLLGDREDDLSFLARRRWDAVLDTCGYSPGPVRAAAELLAGAADRYVFVSTVSVYAQPVASGADESSPLRSTDDQPATYGGLKVLCEGAVAAVFLGRALIVRPCLIVGPHDFTGRFSYWVWRLTRGGEVLAPGGPDLPVQLIDARDLGGWLVRCVENGTTGIFNATGPAQPLTLGEVLKACKAATPPKTPATSLTWVDEGFLLEQGVAPWTGLPLWIPGRKGSALQSMDNGRARTAGLTYRPLAETIRDTHAWLVELGRALPVSDERGGPISPEREAELLRAWHARL